MYAEKETILDTVIYWEKWMEIVIKCWIDNASFFFKNKCDCKYFNLKVTNLRKYNHSCW